MENLNNLIWTDEDANNVATIQSESRPMHETCFRGPDGGGSGGGFIDIGSGNNDGAGGSWCCLKP